MAKKPSTSATEAKKKALANRGTFDVASNSQYGRPYHHLTMASVGPYSKRAQEAVAVWGGTLEQCVPPAFAVRYRELLGELDVAMVDDQFKRCAELSASLIKALDVMDATARAAGHLPPMIDGHFVQWGNKVYLLLASGSVSAARKAHPSAIVYHMSDVCALLSGRADSLQAVANAFPNARITRVGPMIEDEIDL